MSDYVLIYEKVLNDTELELLKINSSASRVLSFPNSHHIIKPLFTVLEYLQLLNYPLACSAVEITTDASLFLLQINSNIKPKHVFKNIESLNDSIEEYANLVKLFNYVKSDKSAFSDSVFEYSDLFSDVFDKSPNLNWDETLSMIAEKIDADDQFLKDYFLTKLNKIKVDII